METKPPTITRSTIYRFIDERNAVSFAQKSTKMMMGILGDDGRFWVVTPADHERLVQQGYESFDVY